MLKLLLLSAALSASPTEERRPNVVLILADDLGYECVAANGGGPYRTPNLDRLAEAGVRFTRCHSQPLCTPTRVQLLTGLYNSRNYTAFAELDSDATTLAQMLRAGGYATCAVGKWQLGGDAEAPRRFGFGEYCLYALTEADNKPSRYKRPRLEVNGRLIQYTEEDYGPDVVFEYAQDFIERHREEPFFLYYSMLLPHTPLEATPESRSWLAGRQPDRRYFIDMVAYVDKLVGKLAATLERNGIADKTLILFTGDNGTNRQITSTLDGEPYPGGKSSTLDSGTHVPLIVSWPGEAAAGEVCDDLVDSTDFVPTVLEAAGLPAPDGLDLDGRSFLPQVLGEEGTPREWIYCWYQERKSPRIHEFARTERYKYYVDGGRLYDVVADFDEAEPIPAEAMTDEQRRLRDTLRGVTERYAR